MGGDGLERLKSESIVIVLADVLPTELIEFLEQLGVANVSSLLFKDSSFIKITGKVSIWATSACASKIWIFVGNSSSDSDMGLSN